MRHHLIPMYQNESKLSRILVLPFWVNEVMVEPRYQVLAYMRDKNYLKRHKPWGKTHLRYTLSFLFGPCPICPIMEGGVVFPTYTPALH